MPAQLWPARGATLFGIPSAHGDEMPKGDGFSWRVHNGLLSVVKDGDVKLLASVCVIGGAHVRRGCLLLGGKTAHVDVSINGNYGTIARALRVWNMPVGEAENLCNSINKMCANSQGATAAFTYGAKSGIPDQRTVASFDMRYAYYMMLMFVFVCGSALFGSVALLKPRLINYLCTSTVLSVAVVGLIVLLTPLYLWPRPAGVVYDLLLPYALFLSASISVFVASQMASLHQHQGKFYSIDSFFVSMGTNVIQAIVLYVYFLLIKIHMRLEATRSFTANSRVIACRIW